MPTYNTPISYLKEAVESILNQTFQDFEFIIIDDGSTNETGEYLKSIQDERLKIIRNPTNYGVTKSLNIGLHVAKGKYVARMDADDISLPNRFERQITYLDSHSNVVVVGSYYEEFTSDTNSKLVVQNIKSQSLLRIKYLFRPSGPCHPSIMIRNDVLKLHRIQYAEELLYSQDYGLFIDLYKYGNIEVFPDILIKKRSHGQQVSSVHRKIQREADKIIQKRLLEDLGVFLDGDDLDFHYRLGYEDISKHEINRAFNHLFLLVKRNCSSHKYRRIDFLRVCSTVLIRQILNIYFPKIYMCLYQITHLRKYIT